MSTFPISAWEFENCFEKSCEYGSYNDKQVMSLMALSAPVIYLGCFASCLSSALSCMVSGPKTFQALCQDKVYPYLTRFGVGYGKTDDPLWSYGLGFIIAIVFIIIGKFVVPIIYFKISIQFQFNLI
jgi:solute carrier family 12 sodium/potassium/chloride transporter 2